MRWVTATCALAMVLIGAYLIVDIFRHFHLALGSRTDETDVTVLIGGTLVLAGLLVLTVLAVTT